VKHIYVLSTIVILVLSNYFGIQQVEASGNKNTTFTVRAVHTESQKDKNLPYFYFDGKEGKSYKIKVAIKNVSPIEIKVAAQIKNGLSNPYGAIEYTNETKTIYSSFVNNKYEIKTYIEGPELIELKPNEEKTVEYIVNIPENMTKGELLGALGFMDAVDLEIKEENTTKNTATLVSRLEYIISIFVNLSEKVEPKIIIEETKIDVKTKFPKLELYLKNESPILIKDITLNYKVYKKTDLTYPLFEGEKLIERFSPSTNMIYLLAYEGEVLEEGDYVIDISLSGKALKENVEKRMNFTISYKDEKQYEEKVTDGQPILPKAKPDGIMDYIWYIVGGIILFILGMMIPVWIRKRKDKKELNKSLPIKDGQTEKVELSTDEETKKENENESKKQ
jgi:hypothetical protein